MSVTRIEDNILYCEKCPRCGQEHKGLVVAAIQGEEILSRCPYCNGKHVYKYYAACPETGCPILLFLTREAGCREAAKANQEVKSGDGPTNTSGG